MGLFVGKGTYINKLAMIPELKENNRQAIAEIGQQLCKGVMEDFAE